MTIPNIDYGPETLTSGYLCVSRDEAIVLAGWQALKIQHGGVLHIEMQNGAVTQFKVMPNYGSHLLLNAALGSATRKLSD